MGVEVISTEGKQGIIVVCNIKIYERFCSGCMQSIMNVSEAIASHWLTCRQDNPRLSLLQSPGSVCGVACELGHRKMILFLGGRCVIKREAFFL